MHKIKIISTGSYTPQKKVTNFDLEKIMDTSDQWIRERTGIHERRMAVTTDELDESPSGMAAKASAVALEKAGLSPNDIDMIIFATCTPDFQLPSCATLLQTKLNITNRCAAVDVNAACSGFVYGFNTASALISGEMFKRILVVGSELLTREVDFQDRTTSILFGDGCGAMILEQAGEADESAVLSTVLGADGTGKDFFYKEYGGSVNKVTAEAIEKRLDFMKMNGQEMFKVAVRTLAKNAKDAAEKANLTLEMIDWIVPHQANIRILEATASLLKVPFEKFIVNIHKYGNTSAATIPLAFDEALDEGKIKRGQIILLDAFGAGLTSGASLIRY